MSLKDKMYESEPKKITIFKKGSSKLTREQVKEMLFPKKKSGDK